jgi:uncharacterized protein (TIGR02186 family)
MRRVRRAIAVAALAAVGAATPAAAERLVASLSSHRVLITPSFTGAELVLFGTVERDAESAPRAGRYDIVATVSGPRESLVVRRKERAPASGWAPTFAHLRYWYPIWRMLLPARTGDRPLDVVRRLELGLRRVLLPQQIGPDTADVVRDDPFRTSFLRLKQSRGLYVEGSNEITFLTPMLYRANIPLPASPPVGLYDVELKLFADGALIARGNEAFEIVKFGFEQFVASSALSHGLLYGRAAAAMALLTGWLASVVFRRD